MTPPQTIAARYELNDRIGSGAMGEVYRATDTQTGAIVAVKHLKPDLLRYDAGLLTRFQREGEALRDLNHPNIVSLLDIISEDNDHYLVMEYVAGGDLTGLLGDAPQGMPPEQVLAIALELADALTRAHHLNIIHRDLKPANVLIAEDGTPRLSDFGIALHAEGERITESNAIIGTMDYIAPEAINGERVDTRADVWAFGVMLFEMLAGHRPFRGDTLVSLLARILSEPVPDLEAIRPDCPLGLVDLVYRMLEKDRMARIPGVRHVGAALEDILYRREPNQTGSRFATPLPGTWERPKHNLPAQSTAFVGREHELAELKRIISDREVGFISIIAPGGMGKTRLALALAEAYFAAGDAFTDGVYFVELASLSDPNAIVPTLAGATGYQFSGGGRDPRQQILDFLSNKHMLLVLDNFEHLLEGASLVTEIHQTAPDVVVLTTSRQRLEQPGETLFQLTGMDFPDWDTPQDALAYAAVQLFMSSARRVQPGFELTAYNMGFVARICRLVDGMPLGIVLAASWLTILSPQEIADEIQRGLDILETTAGDVEARHQSMRAVCDQTWALMTDDEHQVFARLSVFRGGFTRDAVQAITGVDLQTLMSLSNKSLIRRRVSSGRFEIHELLRQYGEEKLVASDGEDDLNDRHCSYYMSLLSDTDPMFVAGRQLEAAKIIDADVDNLFAAWQRAIHTRQVGLLRQVTMPLCRYGWLRQNLSGSIIALYDAALHAFDEAEAQGELRHMIGVLLSQRANLAVSVQADPLQTRPMAQRGLAILRETDDTEGLAWSLSSLGWLKGISGNRQDREHAIQLLDEAHDLFEALEQPAFVGAMLTQKAWILKRLDWNLNEVLELEELAVRLLRQSRNDFWLAIALFWIGLTYQILGDTIRADRMFDEALQLERTIGSGNACLYLAALADTAIMRGDFQRAGEYADDAIGIATDYNFEAEHAQYVVLHSRIASLQEQHEEASRLLTKAKRLFPRDQWEDEEARLSFRRGEYDKAADQFDAILNQFDTLGWSVDISLWLGIAQVKVGQISIGVEKVLYSLKEAQRTDRRFQYPRGLYGLAEVRRAGGRFQEAVELAALVAEHDVTPYEFKVYARKLLDDLAQDLEPDRYEAAIEQGKVLDLDETVELLLNEDLDL